MSLVVHNYYREWKLQLSEVFCSFHPNIFKCKTKTTSKGILLSILKPINSKPRWGGDGKLILHILEALQTAPRKDANTFQAGSRSYSHDIPSIKQIFSVKTTAPWLNIYIFHIWGMKFRFRFENNLPYSMVEGWMISSFQTKTFLDIYVAPLAF